MNQITLTPEQEQAVDAIPNEYLSGLTGHAGTGKTSTSLALISKLRDRGYFPLLTAPTHKAAKVLTKKSGAEAVTLHSLLALVPRPNLQTGERTLSQMSTPSLPSNGFLIVDEASMLSPRLLECIADADLPTVLIGDPGQLPPVGYTNSVFTDYLNNNRGSIRTLTKILRQAGENPLPTVAATMRPGANEIRWPAKDVMGTDGGVQIMRRPDAEREFLAFAKAHDGKEDTVRPWLAYTNAAAHSMGQKARYARYGKDAYGLPYLKGETCSLASPLIVDAAIELPNSAVVTIESDPIVRDLVLYTVPVRTYEMVVKDDIGALHTIMAVPMFERISLLGELKEIALKTFGMKRQQAWENYFNVDDMICDLRSVYASTIHKAQGSGYLDVFIDGDSLTNPYAAPILASLSYTAITRPYHIAKYAK
jgi:exodeoxyribonuclease V